MVRIFGGFFGSKHWKNGPGKGIFVDIRQAGSPITARENVGYEEHCPARVVASNRNFEIMFPFG